MELPIGSSTTSMTDHTTKGNNPLAVPFHPRPGGLQLQLQPLSAAEVLRGFGFMSEGDEQEYRGVVLDFVVC